MTNERRTRQRLIDILNGEWHALHEGTRRAIGVIADEIDALHAENRALRTENNKQHDKNRAAVDELRLTVLRVGGSFVLTIVAAAIGVLFAR